jgi:hypothetical protein
MELDARDRLRPPGQVEQVERDPQQLVLDERRRPLEHVGHADADAQAGAAFHVRRMFGQHRVETPRVGAAQPELTQPLAEVAEGRADLVAQAGQVLVVRVAGSEPVELEARERQRLREPVVELFADPLPLNPGPETAEPLEHGRRGQRETERRRRLLQQVAFVVVERAAAAFDHEQTGHLRRELRSQAYAPKRGAVDRSRPSPPAAAHDVGASSAGGSRSATGSWPSSRSRIGTRRPATGSAPPPPSAVLGRAGP